MEDETIINERRRSDDKWHLRKEIHIAHILTLLGFIIMAISAWSTLDKRVEKNALVNDYQDKMLKEHVVTVNNTFSQIQQDVSSIRTILIQEYQSRNHEK